MDLLASFFLFRGRLHKGCSCRTHTNRGAGTTLVSDHTSGEQAYVLFSSPFIALSPWHWCYSRIYGSRPAARMPVPHVCLLWVPRQAEVLPESVSPPSPVLSSLYGLLCYKNGHPTQPHR